MIARLIHINGLPGIGKTAVAAQFAHHHPLALVVDIDLLRTQLGRWEVRPESRLLARDLAIALAESHLEGGHDVVVPQYLGKLDFISRLERAASAARAPFIEIMLVADPALAVERFRQRRARLAERAHPEADVGEGEIESVVVEAARALAAIEEQRPNVRRVEAAGDLEATYAAVVGAVDRAAG